jgi:hypothetical protein
MIGFSSDPSGMGVGSGISVGGSAVGSGGKVGSVVATGASGVAGAAGAQAPRTKDTRTNNTNTRDSELSLNILLLHDVKLFRLGTINFS